MKRIFALSLALALVLSVSSCSSSAPETTPKSPTWTGAVQIKLSDSGITVDGEAVSTDPSSGVYTANDIVYYEEGKDFTYGEGSEADAHSVEEATAHTVVHITQPGTYALSGRLSAGQIAVDLGEDAEDDPNAVVTLVLNGVDITCTVAPAVIFYNVYECGDKDNPTKDVDTSAAGANVIIADSTSNHVNGSYVARIYEPDTVELSEDGTEVADAKKLHKYDAAFYSKMSMNVLGDSKGLGSLYITAENEGLDSEMHLTIDCGGGSEADALICIVSGNDGINTNEDGVSVTTVNSGILSINVTGETGEGDGIDSNGWLVINGGTVIASACSDSADAGIDSDMGIHINGGMVLANGHMLDHIEDGGQIYAVFTFAQPQSGKETIMLKNSDGNDMMSGVTLPTNTYSVLIFSSPDLTPGDYTLWSGNTLLAHSGISFGGGMMPRPSGTGGPMAPPEWEGQSIQDLPWTPVDGEIPERMEPPEGFEPPEGSEISEDRQPPQMNDDGTITLPDGTTIEPSKMERPEGGFGGRGPGMGGQMGGISSGDVSSVFAITDGGNMFSGITAAE